jgi:hypothetical protein
MVYIKIQTGDNTSTFIADICIDRITVPVGLSVKAKQHFTGIFGSLQNCDSVAWLSAMQVLSDKVYLPLVRKPNIAEVDSGSSSESQ